MFKCLTIYCNTPLSSSLQSPMQILQSRSVRSVLSDQCPMQQGNSLVWTLNSLEANTRMNIYLHMIYIWDKMICSKTQEASSGFQLPLQAHVQNQEVTRSCVFTTLLSLLFEAFEQPQDGLSCHCLPNIITDKWGLISNSARPSPPAQLGRYSVQTSL